MSTQAWAGPPAKGEAKPVWIKHEVVPGERLDEIAARYQIRRKSLIRWNKLDPNKPRIRAGQKLKVYAKDPPPQRELVTHVVQKGETWKAIAEKYEVEVDHLRHRWNRKVPKRFKSGQKLRVWVDPAGIPVPELPPALKKLPLEKVKQNALSTGKPNRGRITNSAPVPINKELYTVLRPENAWGSTHAITHLQIIIAKWRQLSRYEGRLVIADMSKKGGGRLRPHSSHQSGRDVDIRLPLRNGQKPKFGAVDPSEIDWRATWKLIEQFVESGEVQYIFLTTSRQKLLYQAAKKAGASEEMLKKAIQYPRKRGTNYGIVRHAEGHSSHIHVRFTCAEYESTCESY